MIAVIARRPRMLPCVATATAAVYAWWNVRWIALGLRPPSMLLGLAGLPAPTTGGTRALVALFDGRLIDSLRWNAMSVPIVALFVASIGMLACQWVRGRRIVLSRTMSAAWGVTLAAAWVLKFALGPRYW